MSAIIMQGGSSYHPLSIRTDGEIEVNPLLGMFFQLSQQTHALSIELLIREPRDD